MGNTGAIKSVVWLDVYEERAQQGHTLGALVAGRAGGEGCPREWSRLSSLREATSCLASNQPFPQRG